jgi:amidohydrolase
MHELVKRAAEKAVGAENIAVKKRGLGGEDFSYFANEKPGYMFRLGIKNEEKGITHTAHTDLFDLDESALKYGVKTFVTFILDNMKGIDF